MSIVHLLSPPTDTFMTTPRTTLTNSRPSSDGNASAFGREIGVNRSFVSNGSNDLTNS